MKYIQDELGFGNDHHVLPVFKSGGMHGAKLQRFQCVKNKTNGEIYYQAKAYMNQIYFSFTVELKYLMTLENLTSRE